MMVGVHKVFHASARGVALVLALASVAGLSGCVAVPEQGETVAEEGAPLLNCGTTLGVAPLDNTCGHGWVGPFGDANGTGSPATPIAASASQSFSGASPNFASPQRLYRVTLPGTTSHTGTVKFTPAVTEDIAIATDVDTAFTVLTPTGTAVGAILNQDVTTACTQVAAKLTGETGVGLKRLRIYHLTAGTVYRITFGATTAAAINVVLDEPNDYLNSYFTDSDHDGYGDPNSPIVSECTAPTGSVPNQGDCNDANASISPAASDSTADSVDNDCDGTVDDPAANSDLETVSLTNSAVPGRLAVGQSTQVLVKQTVTNNGLQATDVTVTRTATATAGGTIAPASVSQASTSLALGEYRVSSTTYTVTCTSFGNVTFTVNGSVAPTRSIDVDPEPSNNQKSAQFTILCAPCMEATSSLVLADRDRVTSQDTVAGGYYELGSKATMTGNVSVNGNVFIRSEATITGTLRLSGGIQRQLPSSVPTIVNGPVTVPPIPQFTFSVGTTDLNAGSGPWAPGVYRDGSVGANATVNLRSGVYNFRNLTVSPDATVAFDTSAGDVFVNVEQSLSFADRSDVTTTGAGKVLFYTNATGNVRLGTDMSFSASISAPKTTLQVSSRTTINGCTSANRIAFEPDVTQTAGGFPAGFPIDPTVPPPSCSDGVQNGSETGVDCGGSCLNSCATCSDGLKNGSETGVDCGGSCAACPTCSDGIKNGDETGVDCGGSCGTTCGACTNTTYQAETMTHSTGVAVTGGWNLSTNGFISTLHNFAGGPSRIVVAARGVIANGVGPHLVLSVGGVAVGNVTVNSTTYSNYTFDFTTTPGSKEIRVTYDNDLASPNRDLILDFVQVVCMSNTATLSVSFPVTANWGTGYCVDVAITNTGTAATNSWTVVLNTQQSTIYTEWNAFSTGITGQITLTPFFWNRNINPGQTIRSVGFCANRAAGNTTALPTLVSVTGS